MPDPDSWSLKTALHLNAEEPSNSVLVATSRRKGSETLARQSLISRVTGQVPLPRNSACTVTAFIRHVSYDS